MNNDDHKHSGHFDASLPMPEMKIDHSGPADDTTRTNPAADLIRQKVDAAYTSAPPADAEVDEVSHMASSTPQSKHQQFIDELIGSGKSLPEIQEAWHEYYAGLTDTEKHAVWEEFYAEHEKASSFNAGTAAQPQPVTTVHHGRPRKITAGKQFIKQKAATLARKPAPKAGHVPKRASPLRSALFGLTCGALVILIFLFSFFNERFIAPFIQPSRTVTSTPIISDSTSIGANPEIIIPKINVEIPVVYTVTTIDDNAIENALEGGVVHYADTALPGQDGNVVIVGHSSNNIFNQGKYKFAFVLLSRLDTGDTFYLQKDGVRYTYEVYQKEIVAPTDVSVLGPASKPATASLITCDPPGTSTNRLVVTGQQISPDPSSDVAGVSTDNIATKAAIIPGNSPTLWSRVVKWFES